MVVSLLEQDVSVKLQALAQENKLDVLSRPYILTSDNQEADITVGNEVPFITSTDVDSNGGIHNSTTYQDIGIILDGHAAHQSRGTGDDAGFAADFRADRPDGDRSPRELRCR